MRSLRGTNARDRVFNKRKVHSSLSTLPCTKSRNNKPKMQVRSTNRKRNSNLKSITKTHNKYIKDEYKDIEDYDSNDSLDQLLDNAFVPIRNKPKSNHDIKSPKIVIPRKTIRSTAGNKRSKAMALMATTMKGKKQSNIKQDRKKEKRDYKTIRNALKYTTPINSNNKKSYSNFTSLRKERKIITPKYETYDNKNKNKNNNAFVTPKQLNGLKELTTPCTPTPVKLMKGLNVKTPQTYHVNNNNNNNKNNNKNKIKRKLSLESDVKDENKIEISNNKLKSWKDIQYTPNQNRNPKNDIDDLSEFERKQLQICESNLQLPMKLNLLLQKFNAMESTLSLYMRKNSFFVPFQNIQHCVQQITKKKLSKKEFQQILTILPSFYHIQWTVNINKSTRKKELKLTATAMDCEYQCENENEKEKQINKKDKLREIGVKFLKVSKLKERVRVFKVRLYEYVAVQHKQYLVDNILIEFDPFIRGQWHKRFDLENINEIKCQSFPNKPIKNMNEMDKMIAEQKKKLQEIVENEMKKVKEEQKNNNDKGKAIPKHLRGLSPTFIAKIRAKTKNKMLNNNNYYIKSTKNKKINGEFEKSKKRLNELPYLVNLIRGIYISLKKSSMSCNDLIVQIKKRHKNKYVLNEEIWKQLQQLNELKSKFFIIKQGPIVKVAKFSKKANLKEVFEEINEKIKQ